MMKPTQTVRLCNGGSVKAPISASVAVVSVIYHAKLAAECDCLMHYLVCSAQIRNVCSKECCYKVEHRHSTPEANDWVTCKVPACNYTGKTLVADWHSIQQSA